MSDPKTGEQSETTQRVLAYQTPREPLRKLSIEESSDSITITFPVLPAWAFIFPIVCVFVIPLLAALQIVLSIQAAVSLSTALGIKASPFDARIWLALKDEFIAPGLGAIFWASKGAFLIWKYRRFGRVPRVLHIRADGLTITSLGFRRMRERHWPAAEIVRVELSNSEKDLFTRKRIATLCFQRRRGLALRFRMSKADPEQLTGLAAKICAMLSCAMNDSFHGSARLNGLKTDD